MRTSLDAITYMAHVKYHCPYCDTLIDHQPSLAGERVACSKCKGEYYEPTDPLPGRRPQKAEPITDSHRAMAVPLPSPASARKDAKPLSACLPGEMANELARRGLQAVLLSRSSQKPEDVSVVSSNNLAPNDVDVLILRVALNIIETKWPDVYTLVANRLKN
jgi:hypothetical protein